MILLADDDHYDDGMVLLKHALCWEYEDIVNAKRNVAPMSQRSYISREAINIIKGNLSNVKLVQYKEIANWQYRQILLHRRFSV